MGITRLITLSDGTFYVLNSFKNYAMVCIEDLQARNLRKSAAGMAEKLGKSVRAKFGLNKAILDEGWFEFCRQPQ